MPKKKKQVDVENAGIVPRDDYEQVLRDIIAAGFCPFCEEHFFKHHRKPIEVVTKHWLVTENTWPYKGSRFHFLFIARTHVEKTEGLSPAAWADLQTQYRALVKRYRIKGATLFIRSGDMEMTGATVTHIHAHLVGGGRRTKNPKPIKALIGFEQ